MGGKTYAQLTPFSGLQDADLVALWRGTGPLAVVTAVNLASYVSSKMLSTANTWTAAQTFSALTTSQDANAFALSAGRYSSGYGGSILNFVDTSGGANHPTFVSFQFNGSEKARIDNAGNAALNGGLTINGSSSAVAVATQTDIANARAFAVCWALLF